jgi:hypothetical protein
MSAVRGCVSGGWSLQTNSSVTWFRRSPATRELAGLLRDDADKISSIGRWTGRVSRAGAEAARTVEEAENRYPRVALLFKPKSTVAVESAHAVSELRHAQAELKEVPPDFHEAEAAVSSADTGWPASTKTR